MFVIEGIKTSIPMQLRILADADFAAADILNDAGLATLLIDLLSKQEDENYQTRFDIDLLTDRLNVVVQWLEKQSNTQNLGLGIFGSSTGAAAALRVASENGKEIQAVVCAAVGSDLAMNILNSVTAPTLFIYWEGEMILASSN